MFRFWFSDLRGEKDTCQRRKLYILEMVQGGGGWVFSFGFNVRDSVVFLGQGFFVFVGSLQGGMQFIRKFLGVFWGGFLGWSLRDVFKVDDFFVLKVKLFVIFQIVDVYFFFLYVLRYFNFYLRMGRAVGRELFRGWCLFLGLCTGFGGLFFIVFEFRVDYSRYQRSYQVGWKRDVGFFLELRKERRLFEVGLFFQGIQREFFRVESFAGSEDYRGFMSWWFDSLQLF